MKILRHTELEVYRRAFEAAMRVFELSKEFPREEKYSLTDQIRRSSRSVAANTAEAWRKRRYEGSFVSKISDAETEAAETQTWLEFANRCNYLPASTTQSLNQDYEEIISILVSMRTHAHQWTL